MCGTWIAGTYVGSFMCVYDRLRESVMSVILLKGLLCTYLVSSMYLD